MVTLIRPIGDGRYHLPECPYHGKYVFPWAWAENKSLFQVLSETYEKKGMVQPCKHCIMSKKIKPEDFVKESG